MTELKPPAQIAWLSDVIGAEAALRLMELRGGTRVYVPRYFDPNAELAQALGDEAWKAIVQRWGNGTLKVPTCRWWRAQIYAGREMTYPEIALKLGCSETTVWRYLHPERMTASQLAFTFAE